MNKSIGAKPIPDVIDLMRSGQHNLKGDATAIEPEALQMIMSHAIQEIQDLRFALYHSDGQRHYTHLYDEGRHIAS